MKQVLFVKGLYDAIQACVNYILGLTLPTVTTDSEKEALQSFLDLVKLSINVTEEAPVETDTTVTIVKHYSMNPSMITPSVSVLSNVDVLKAFLMGVVNITCTEVTTTKTDAKGNKTITVTYSYVYELADKYTKMSDLTIKYEVLSSEVMLAIFDYTAASNEEAEAIQDDDQSDDTDDQSDDNDDQSSTDQNDSQDNG